MNLSGAAAGVSNLRNIQSSAIATYSGNWDSCSTIRSRPVRREHPSPMGEKTGTWIGFAPFSAQQGKTYPEPLARETVRLLAGRYDRVFIHSGGGAEAEFAQEMGAPSS